MGAIAELPPTALLLASVEKSRDRQFRFIFSTSTRKQKCTFFQIIIILCGFGSVVISSATWAELKIIRKINEITKSHDHTTAL